MNLGLDLSKLQPPGLDILIKNPYTKWIEQHYICIQLNVPLSFENEQALFKLGWKYINNVWFFNLIEAHILGVNNE